MTDVLALDMFARSRYHSHALAAHHHPCPAPNPKHATTSGGGPLYYRQHEVIQLIEVPAPPRQQHPSTITSSSVASSSSYSASCDSEASESEPCSSYCSSDEESLEESPHGCYDDTYSTRLTRVLAWRDGFGKAMGVAFAPGDSTSAHSPPFLKRRIENDDDAMSQSSKRSRSSTGAHPNAKALARRRLSSHCCSACDSDFATPQGLQEHAQHSKLGDACRVAVEYGLES
ncbi:hypothetical protein BDW22DRAFT_1428412 [Trametopsis cervina]|nr:hypothetical protein BDW22DRAFT_1428412 [Trametopsis cervina]